MADAGPSVQQRIALPLHDRRCIGDITISTEIGRIGTGIVPGIGTGIAPGIGTGIAPGVGTGIAPGVGTGIAPGVGTGIEAPRYSEISDRQLLSSAVNIFVESVLVNIYQW
jgi:hypothetical protein